MGVFLVWVLGCTSQTAQLHHCQYHLRTHIYAELGEAHMSHTLLVSCFSWLSFDGRRYLRPGMLA
jgi:hypothetical protein